MTHATDPQRLKKIEALFHGALERDETERGVFLDEACQGDLALRNEVSALLDAGEEADSAFEQAIRGTLDLAADDSTDKQRQIGPYRLLREVGRGGLSTVYLAERADQQFQMQVAIKLLRRGLESRDMLRRVRQERQILASLDHPNIARLLDGGANDAGIPYFVLEYIEGEPIDRYCERRALSTAQRLALFRQVCAAVHYAHQNLVIHRDLKPSNILVTADGTPKLLDFGIAKLLKPELATETLAQTAPQMRLLTPAYASPEQVRGQPLTTGTDIYSLGVLLYRLLTGQAPYPLPADQPQELERIICEVTPTKPSQAIATNAAGATERLRRQLAGDLDNIALMALRKEPELRYGSAAQLAEDLRRHLEGLPVVARPATLSYRLQKLVARHRVGVAVAAIVALLLASVVGFYTAQLKSERDRAQAAQGQAEQTRDELEEVADFLRDLLENADPSRSRGAEVSVREVLDRGSARIERLADRPALQASLMGVMGRVYRSLREYAEARSLLEASLARSREIFGEESLETARAKIELEELLFELDEIDTAAQLVEEALATQRRLLAGQPHEDIASSLNNLGTVRYIRGDLDGAEQALRDAIRMYDALPVQEEEVATYINNLAVTLHEKGQFDEAEQLYRRTQAIKTRTLGEDHPDVAAVLFNLGMLQADRGESGEAVELLQQTLTLQTHLFGAENEEVLRTTHALANILDLSGEADDAAQLYAKALEIFRRRLPESPGMAPLLQDFGDFHLRHDAPAAAAPLLQEALAQRRRSDFAEPCRIAAAESSLGAALSNLGRYAQAEPLLLAGDAALHEACADEAAAVRSSLQRLIALYERWGQADDAEPFRQRLHALE